MCKEERKTQHLENDLNNRDEELGFTWAYKNIEGIYVDVYWNLELISIVVNYQMGSNKYGIVTDNFPRWYVSQELCINIFMRMISSQ